MSEGTEGLAGMHVHGGETDENMYMLDNVPLYHVNHFAGLFSAFNPDMIRYIDFFKTAVPAKYDGHLSSFMDVRLINGQPDGHHGSARLGLTSGAFNISGPIGGKTTYMAGIRRSWFDVLTVPFLAIVNSSDDNEKVRFHYYFTDLNAKITHRFSPRLNAFVSAYYGNDMLKTGSTDSRDYIYGWYEDSRYDFNWGNLVVQTGLNYRMNSAMTGELSAAYTRFFGNARNNEIYKEIDQASVTETMTHIKIDNNIHDWIFRGDFDWTVSDNSRIRFGGSYIRHTFLPARTAREYSFNGNMSATHDSTWAYGANELNVYIEDEWKISDRLRANIGLHLSLFNIDGKTHYGVSPRASLSYKPATNIALKGAYTRTVQYVHRLSQSYLSLPTVQWIPITGGFKPQTADKIAIGAYWRSQDGTFEASVEGYCKLMHKLIDYCDEYYLKSPLEMWNARLTSGRGSARGLDLNFEKRLGRLTGHVSYTLAWANRTFKDKNGGKTFPARFDNRHTIKISLNWEASKKVSVNAAWTGRSGNMFTFLPQIFESPDLTFSYEEAPLRYPKTTTGCLSIIGSICLVQLKIGEDSGHSDFTTPIVTLIR